MAPLISVQNLSKSFPGVKALDRVQFDLRPGEVHALMGENGAGKSTLMKILAGVYRKDSGEVLLDGEPVEIESPAHAQSLAIGIIHQELHLMGHLTAAQNIFLGRELRTKTGAIDYAGERRITSQLMQRLEELISPGTLVQDLRVGQQQVIEIARALAADTRILIMDEPTSALSASEVEVLFKVIRDLTSHGVAIVYISHHLEEAIEIADYAVVFRDGELVATEDAANIDLPWVVRQMVGREADYDFRDEPRDYGDVALSIQGVTVADLETGRVTVNNVSTVRVTYNGTFETATSRLTYTAHLDDSAGPDFNYQQVTEYRSTADFVDEVKSIPPRTLSLRSTATGGLSFSVNNSYDAQRRLTGFTRTAAGETITTTYTSWDSAGRPTAGARGTR